MPKSDIHPDAPAGGGGPGFFRSAVSLGLNPDMDVAENPSSLGLQRSMAASNSQVSVRQTLKNLTEFTHDEYQQYVKSDDALYSKRNLREIQSALSDDSKPRKIDRQIDGATMSGGDKNSGS
jgi:hypothetical protein